jgi:hypothetical protein
MKILDDLAGFAVLTSPLLLILILLPLFLWLAIKLGKRFKRRSAKIAGGVGIFLLGFTVLFGDEIVGRIYLSYLCNTEAGVKVYQIVELPAEYWDEQGRAKFYDEKNGNFSLSNDYPTKLKIEKYSSFLNIDKLVGVLKDQKTGALISENILYMHWGGWIRRNFSPSNTATSCDSYLEQYGSFIRQVFKPANTK